MGRANWIMSSVVASIERTRALTIGEQSLDVIRLLMLVLNREILDGEFDYQGPEPRDVW